MLLAVDIGNSSISVGLFDSDTAESGRPALRMKAKLASDTRKSADEYRMLLRGLLTDAGFSTSDVTVAVLGSVVPTLTHTLREAVERLCPPAPGGTPVTVRVVGEGMRSGIGLMVDDPAQLGADIVANAAAAVWLYGAPVIVLDFGTANVMTAVDTRKSMIGVSIAPGLRMSLDGLRREAARMPYIELKAPSSSLGRSTEAAARSGVVLGSVCMTDGMVGRVLAEYGLPESTPLVATGGLAHMVAPALARKTQIEPDLTLYGLFRMYALTAAKEAKTEKK